MAKGKKVTFEAGETLQFGLGEESVGYVKEANCFVISALGELKTGQRFPLQPAFSEQSLLALMVAVQKFAEEYGLEVPKDLEIEDGYTGPKN